MIGMTSAPDTTPTIMDVKQLLLVQINEALEPPAPRPNSTAEIEYHPECWYRLKDEAERTRKSWPNSWPKTSLPRRR